MRHKTRGPFGSSRRRSITVWRSPRLLLALASCLSVGATAAHLPDPLPCVAAPPGDTAPWVWNARVLDSFPPDNPEPRFIGGFGDAKSLYQLELWRDSGGIFGELILPSLEADSPSSRLYDARLEDKGGAISFTARFPWMHPAEWQFSGVFRANSISGVFKRGGGDEKVAMRKLGVDKLLGWTEGFYSSRAKFECAMTLFHRN